jgi:transmembrane sensor
MKDFEHMGDAEDQAALWAARLDGSTLSASDREALASWLEEKPEHRALLSQYCQFSADLEEKLVALLGIGGVSLPPEKATPRQRWSGRWVVGFALAAAAMLAVAFVFTRPAAKPASFATSHSQRQLAVLSDGTRVELNAHTQITFQDGAQRHLRLTSGEAYFIVSKNKHRPFIVDTPSGSVRVTGTVFNVRAENARALEVAVVEGSVEVKAGPRDPVALTAHDYLIASDTGVSVKSLPAAGLDDVLAWRQGQIVFDGVPLRDALDRFARYHGRKITATTAAGDLRLGGRFSLDDIDGFFAALEAVLPVLIEKDANGDVKVKLRSE